MTYTRKNVYTPGATWADPILWYARGVKAMQAEALAEPTSWRFYAGIHGFNKSLWEEVGYLKSSETLPSTTLQKKFWRQCQHGSWYFLPWHRGYLIALEANIRSWVIKAGGPADWALPYWNYFAPGEYPLPPEFASEDWPDGKGDNPLFVTARYGPNGDGKVYVPLSEVNLNAMGDPDFIGPATGASPGFGGPDTGFSHSGGQHGGIESQPHDMVHVYVGGSQAGGQQLPGLMSVPDIAGLDPIFYLHHANIDRLWEVWRQNPPTDVDPTDPNWLKGPANIGERAFEMPMPDGSTYVYTPGELTVIATLPYVYDDLSPTVAAATPETRLHALGFSPAAMAEKVPAMKAASNVELVGATHQSFSLHNAELHTTVALDHATRQKVTSSLTPGAQQGVPDRVFLNLENIRGASDAVVFNVYVGVPDGENVADHSEALAGSIGLFGVTAASDPDEEHGGQGLTHVIEITKIVDQLHLKKGFDVDSLNVRLVPANNLPDHANVTIGRISIYRQGQ